MKKIILLAGAVALAFSFNACQQDNGDQSAKDWATIDSMAKAKSTELMASMNNECMTAATAKGLSMVDSVMKTMKKGGSGSAKTTTTTTTTTEVTPTNPKGDKMGGNNTNTETKTDKMGGNKNQTTTQSKKDKMGGQPK